ncbi:hypothetical protein ACEWY4_027383 [Coilia grayii]|uniref:Uncharacterized protein n=1 Tax=Coilia grayii TaxID=363190 RepID=A0ABD1IS85_9TELE
MPKCGVLVVKDPPGGLHPKVPSVLEMNILSKCYQELFGQFCQSLFEAPLLSQAPTAFVHAFQHCQQAETQSVPTLGRVKVRGRRAWRIPGGTTTLVSATCSAQYAGGTVLFEPAESGLPSGLLVSPSLVKVVYGTASIPVVNVGTTNILLSAYTLQSVHVVSLPSGVEEVQPVTATIIAQAAQVGGSVVQEQIEAIELPLLASAEQEQARALLRRYHTVFSAHDGDLGCTNLLSHDIPLLDNVPVRQRYCRIPLLESQVIRESCSPYASPIVLVRKKNGTLWLCVDYRQLNSKTRRDAFPLPRIEESLDALTGASWFSTLDLASSYNQVPVT